MQPIILEELKNALTNEHNRLVAELKGIAQPNPKIAGDWNAQFPKFESTETGSHAAQEEEADEVEEYEVRLAAEGSLETRLLQVNRALERIKIGGYGICAVCKKPIPLDRLRANPAAEYDIGHEPV
ncbi:MAG: TraR/DksA C4-type zinc finger protein [Candidatus Sungiibacteriota bacterium]